MKTSTQETLQAVLATVEASNKQVMVLTRRLAELVAETKAVKDKLAEDAHPAKRTHS